MNQENIGKFIASLRKEKELTQEQLAEVLGVNSRSVSRWKTAIVCRIYHCWKCLHKNWVSVYRNF